MAGKKTTVVGLELPEFEENKVDAANLKLIDAAIAALNGVPQGAFLVTAPAADQVVTRKLTAGSFAGPLTGAVTGNVTGNLTGNVTGNVKGIIQEPVASDVVVSGAIAAKQGLVGLGSSGPLAVSLADPTNVTDDGKVLKLVATTAQAHVITVTGGLAGGANNTVTLGGAIGDMAILEAKGGKWFALPSINATASHV